MLLWDMGFFRWPILPLAWIQEAYSLLAAVQSNVGLSLLREKLEILYTALLGFVHAHLHGLHGVCACPWVLLCTSADIFMSSFSAGTNN